MTPQEQYLALCRREKLVRRLRSDICNQCEQDARAMENEVAYRARKKGARLRQDEEWRHRISIQSAIEIRLPLWDRVDKLYRTSDRMLAIIERRKKALANAFYAGKWDLQLDPDAEYVTDSSTQSNYSTQTQSRKYARESLCFVEDALTRAGIPFTVEEYVDFEYNDRQTQGKRQSMGYRLKSAVPPELKLLVEVRYGTDDMDGLCRSRGVNVRVYMPFLPYTY